MKWPTIPGDTVVFTRGPTWYSYDQGKTWTQKRRRQKRSTTTLVVTAVNYERGAVTVGTKEDDTEGQ